MKIIHIADLIDEKISGEWGVESANGSGTKVLRTTNFTNEGKLKMDSVVERQIEKNIVERKRLRYGDTIIEKSGGSPNQPVGRVVLFDLKAKEPYLCNNFTAILRPSKKVNSEYFFWALFHKHLTKSTLRFQNKTTGILNLKLERYLEEESIKLPDLSIQQKIVDVISQANAARQKRREANRLTEQFLQSAFLEMFGDPVRNEKGWEQKKLVHAVTIKGGGTPSKSKPEYFTGDIPWVSPKDMKLTFIRTSLDKITRKAVDESATHLIPKNSVLVVVRSGILKNALPLAINEVEVAINQDMKAFICPKDLNAIFLMYQLQSLAEYILQFVRATTADNISSDVLKNIDLNIPPFPLQQKFATLVGQVERLRAKQRDSERELENLFQSLMQRYFGDQRHLSFCRQ